MPDARWKRLLDDRLEEAVAVLGRVAGVRGFVVGGSMGRGEPWPLSDIDLIPVYSSDAADELDRCRAELVDWWAASGRAQTLDVGWLAFTTAEVEDAVAGGPAWAADRMADRRWFHGVDKAYGGYGTDPVSSAFAAWIAGVRFDPAVVAARIAVWHRQATEAAAADDSTYLLRESARALRLVLIERWGERLGSMGREWTRFERFADRYGHAAVAARIAAVAGADAATAARRAEIAPAWLQERIDLSYAARLAVGEDVSPAENARDQLAAFAVHVARRRPDLDGPWTGSPDPDLGAHVAELRELLDRHG